MGASRDPEAVGTGAWGLETPGEAEEVGRAPGPRGGGILGSVMKALGGLGQWNDVLRFCPKLSLWLLCDTGIARMSHGPTVKTHSP